MKTGLGNLSRNTIAALCLGLAAQTLPAQDLPRSPSPEGASVYIISPADGERITGPVTVRFGLSGMGVAPAGVDQDGTGHHHLLINIGADAMPDFNLPLPSTNQIRHFGGGQTQVTIELDPGEYRLQLVLGDHLHIPHQPPVVSEPITISVAGE